MNAPPADATPVVLIRARALTGFGALIASLNAPLEPLLDAAGVSRQVLDNPEATLPLTRLAALVVDAAEQLGVPDFGLRLSRYQDIGVLGPVELVALHAATVGEAIEAIAAHMRYHSPGVQVRLGPDPERTGFSQIEIRIADDGSRPQRQLVELAFGVAQQFLMAITGDSGALWCQSFRHDSPMTPACYARYLPYPVRLRQPCDKLSLPTVLLGLALLPADAAIRVAAQRYVGNLMRRFPLDITQQVEAIVERLLAAGGGNLVQVARELGLHERTLQRRLKQQNCYFEDIVERVRRRRAETYLPHAAIPLSQVAALLGYTEQSSFVRACKRWFGMTPQRYRERPCK